ncbi:sigma 54-interacting transcriptional regulator [Dyadobacter chenwenxiniae]|uniref:Sigma 54-interacting transcriptional regulator n=1 Tax=Dyadobacter chenwenxiniae TaxID=2906456 RepID=A0A9X1PT74_9BACT|nr:sigma 54-interacting transcriptional regulator [Dyadobacter chenwenxiniae]MCF0065639.1 sigma 54-interacting transcriptional regulator [Dyadobacter chenwenxiniae]UON85550.1 sigma 54-interacting transcriptional regulator [Dyadobacter chenwenxiniae]
MSGNVLIVEDEFIVANDLRVVLKQAGYKVNGISASVEEADESIKKQKPDLVILDIQLKGKLSGIDFARTLRAENIAFIYLSANSSQKILEEAKSTEPDGFLVKPFREKDLLVSLDIAWYRHTHSLDSKLRQETLLQKQMSDISQEVLDADQKLLKMAGVIQPFVPFDLIASGTRPFKTGQFNDLAYLRIGFNEYQFLGKKEFATILGLKDPALAMVADNSPIDTDANIYDDLSAVEMSAPVTLQKVLADTFKLKSYLVLPVALHNGLVVHYFFYSRQPNAYSTRHINLLQSLKTHLSDVAQTGFDTAESPALSSNMVQPKNSAAIFQSGFKGIIGNHPLLLSALDLTMQVAPYTTSVLILGESGTGKENIARSIHSNSPRKNGPFVKVNCAAIPSALIESELFGHEKGAFTGASEKRKGKFEQANDGTIFLDEIGELPLDMQVKLLRVLQEKEVEYIGSSISKKVNVRIIAATNRNLEKEVAKGTFRLDLYYRLNVFPITLPALRERKSDIPALTEFFANKFCHEFGRLFPGVAESMMEGLNAYDWPGNIRELENVIEQSVILNDGKSKLELKRSLTNKGIESTDKLNIATLEDVKNIQRETEREYIISILRKSKGLIRGANGAAELLNLKPTTLESRMAKLGIQREDFTNFTESNKF